MKYVNNGIANYVRAGLYLFVFSVLGSCGQPVPVIRDVPVTELKEPSNPAADPIETQPVLPSDLNISTAEAGLIALENNRNIQMRRLDVRSSQLDERIEKSVFDPEASASISTGRENGSSGGTDFTQDTLNSSAFVSKKFATGTTIEAELTTAFSDSSLNASPDASSRIGISVTQQLLQGGGIGVNKASIREAGIDTDISKYQLRGFAEYLVSTVEKTYWDLALAQSKMTIYTESLSLAEKQKGETAEKIDAGQLPEIDLAAAEAEVALRKEDLINAKGGASITRLRLLRVLNPAGTIDWNGKIQLKDIPKAEDIALEAVENHVKAALALRPDLKQAELQDRKGILELQRTRNGVLPKLDLFINLGSTGYADSFSDSLDGLNDGYYDAEIGLSLSYPSSGGSPRAVYEKARVSSRKTKLALENMKDIVQYDVRTAYIEVMRAKEQVAATTLTRKAQDEKLRAEIEKFNMGKSTTLLVASVQRDSVAGRIAEIEAVVNYLKSVIDFYLAEGTLLQRRGIKLEN